MSTYTIARDIDIDAPVDVVWHTITEADQICRWFSDRAEVDARPGGTGALTFEHGGGAEPVVAKFVVVDVERPHRFSYRWGQPDNEEATADNSLLVTFSLTAQSGERTRLQVVETGLERLAWSDEEKASYAEDHNHGWQVNGDRLQQLFAASTK